MDKSLIFLNCVMPPEIFSKLIIALELGQCFFSSIPVINSTLKVLPMLKACVDETAFELPEYFVPESWIIKIKLYIGGYELLRNALLDHPILEVSWFHEFSFLDMLFTCNAIDWEIFFREVTLSVREQKCIFFSGDLGTVIKDSLVEVFDGVCILTLEKSTYNTFCFSSKKLQCKTMYKFSSDVWYLKYRHFSNSYIPLFETKTYFI